MSNVGRRIFIDAAHALALTVHRIGAAALLAKHWPDEGGRHDAELALACFLLRGGMADADALPVLNAVARAGGSTADDARRATTIRTTRECLEGGDEAKGGPTLAELLGDKGEAILRKVGQ